jgi:hypothetical protein
MSVDSIEGVDPAQGGDVSTDKTQAKRGHQKPETWQHALVEKTGKAADRSDENEQQSEPEEPGGEDSDNQAPNAPS